MPSTVSRRTALQLGLAASAIATVGLPGTTTASAADEFDPLRLRWQDLATGGEIDPADPAYAGALAALGDGARELRDTMDVSAGRTMLWPDLPLSPSTGNFGISYTRLRTLALARATRGTGLTGDEPLGRQLVDALDFLHRVAYHPGLPETGNWWFWEIGAPKALLDTCLFGHDALDEARIATYLTAVDRFVPDPNRRTNSPNLRETGANRVDKAVIVALRGILGRSAEKVAAGRDALSDVAEAGRNSVFTYVESGDGFYRDGSFVQHGNLAYVGTYGNVALAGVANLLALLGGSSWQITDPNRAVILDAVGKSFAPFVRDGLMMDCVRGRAISRERETDHDDGHTTISSVLLLATGVDEPYASSYKARAKGWITRDRLADYLRTATVPQIARAKAVLADPAVRPPVEQPGHQQFHHQDRVVHRGAGWTFAIAMSSKRMARYEWGNGENLRGWYVGDGMTYLYGSDHAQFSDGFWPTVDSMRMPGTTVSLKPRVPHGSGFSTVAAYADWVGGASYRGIAGAVGMHLINHDKALQARKSWFCLPDAVVALGAGITGTDGHPVVTVVENRKLDDERFTLTPRWAHLEGTGGYLFPAGGELRTLAEERTGAWRDINTGNDTSGSTTPITRRYRSLWFEHGTDPADGGYAYVLLPGATMAQTWRRAVDPGFRILANTASAQAVQDVRRRLVLANFWTAGTAGGLTVDGPASVVAGIDGRRLHVALSDPSRTAATVRLTVHQPARRPVTTDPSVTVVELGRRVVLDVAVGGSRGGTHLATFDRG